MLKPLGGKGNTCRIIYLHFYSWYIKSSGNSRLLGTSRTLQVKAEIIISYYTTFNELYIY